MKTVWKFQIKKNPGVIATFEMPPICEPLYVGMQDGVVTFWACVLPADPTPMPRAFFYSGTGHDVPMGATYIGTCVDGPFVWHVWEDNREVVRRR